MINLTTPEEQLLKEIREDNKHLVYWHQKHFGGRRKYEKWQDEQLALVKDKPSGYELIGDMVDYHSLRTGNRWKTFDITSSYGYGNTYTRMFCFCYFDTYGSVGAFMPAVDKMRKGLEYVMVFPSHFFLRYADRMGIQHRDAALVCEFYTRNHVLPLMLSPDEDKKGRKQITVAAKEGVCYGVARSERVYEIRTFLTYEQLSPKQAREAETLKTNADASRDLYEAPEHHTFGRMLTDKEFNKRMVENAKRIHNLTDEQHKMLDNLIFEVVDSTGDDVKVMNEMIKKLNGDKAEINLKYMGKVYECCLEVVKRTLRPTFKDVVEIIHKLKGDNFDWNKWFWMYLNKNKKFMNPSEGLLKRIDQMQKDCLDGRFDYNEIINFFTNNTEE